VKSERHQAIRERIDGRHAVHILQAHQRGGLVRRAVGVEVDAVAEGRGLDRHPELYPPGRQQDDLRKLALDPQLPAR